MHRRQGLHAVTWLLWAIAAAVTVELAPSPVYVALVIAVAALVVEVRSVDSPLARAFPLLVLVGVSFAVVRLVLTTATTHNGTDILFTTPALTLPRLLGGFTVGGTVELPVILQSAAEGFAIVGVMAAFGAFNAVVSHHELVQAAPRAFHEPGLVVTVALAFVPSTIGAVHAVREADRARTGGRVVRRGRLLRLSLPIVESGMERAVSLAESMDARGFGRDAPAPAERAAGWLGLLCLLALGGAFVALVARATEVAVVLGIAGALSLAGAVTLASARSPRPRHRAACMQGRDWALAAVVLGAPAGIALLAASGEGSLAWSATPLRWPTFNPWAALAIAALCAPAVWGKSR